MKSINGVFEHEQVVRGHAEKTLLTVGVSLGWAVRREWGGALYSLVSKENTAPRGGRRAVFFVRHLQWGLPDLNRGHRHFQNRLAPCESASTGHSAVAFYAFVAFVAQNIKLPREDVRGVTAFGHKGCPGGIGTGARQAPCTGFLFRTHSCTKCECLAVHGSTPRPSVSFCHSISR